MHRDPFSTISIALIATIDQPDHETQSEGLALEFFATEVVGTTLQDLVDTELEKIPYGRGYMSDSASE